MNYYTPGEQVEYKIPDHTNPVGRPKNFFVSFRRTPVLVVRVQTGIFTGRKPAFRDTDG